MPQEFEAYKSPMQDGRRKILPEQYPEIRAKYKELKSERKTATHYGISRRLITFIIHPERLATFQKHRRQIKSHLLHYNKKAHTKAMQKYRAKKRALNIPTKKRQKRMEECPALT